MMKWQVFVLSILFLLALRALMAFGGQLASRERSYKRLPQKKSYWRLISSLMVSAASAFALSACGTTDVMSLGPSTYIVESSHGSLDGGFAKSAAEARMKAEAYCAHSGKVATVLSDQEKGEPGFSFQAVTVTFKCQNKKAN
jgi:hypothetical protein